MSLINKALQELDSRQGAAAADDPIAGGVRIAPVASRRGARPALGSVLLLVAAAGVGAFGWWSMPHGSIEPQASARPAAPPAAGSELVRVDSAPVQPIAVVNVPTPTPAPVAKASVPAVQKSAAAQPVVAMAPSPAPAPAVGQQQRTRTTERQPLASASPPAEAVARAPLAPTVKQIVMEGTVTTSVSRRGPSEAGSGGALIAGKSVGPQQLSENLYRQAVVLMQKGNGIDARPLLRKSLAADSFNAPARQLLASLLVESNDLAEASALLETGVQLTPQRSELSMGLARLQQERGDASSALKTLERGLSSAAQDPQYNAFYAALLQHAARHEEAVRHYLVALQGDPTMPTWLVGIAISLEALGKDQEAAEAYARARDSGKLSETLLAFVARRLDQVRP